MRRRMNKAHRDTPAQSSLPSYATTPGPSQRHHLSKSTPTPHRPLVYLADSETLTQDHPLPRLPGQVGFAGDRPQDGLVPVSRQPADPDNPNIADLAFDYEPPFQPNMDEPVDPTRTRHRRKRVAQWKRWEFEIIPVLIAPYMNLLEATHSLRDDPLPPRMKVCTCGEFGRNLAITIVKFTGESRLIMVKLSTKYPSALELVNVRACKCSPAPQQLLEKGYFPCAPYHPTLAVEIRMLQFVTKLFVRVSPNNTAWCATVEDFLQGLGYKLTSAVRRLVSLTYVLNLISFCLIQGSLRRRFAVALTWFNSLQQATSSHVEKVLLCVRKSITELEDGLQTPAPSENPSVGQPRSSQATVEHVEDDDDQETTDVPPQESRKRPRVSSGPPFPEPLPRTRPSDYLRSQCPLCFGGKMRNELQGCEVY